MGYNEVMDDVPEIPEDDGGESLPPSPPNGKVEDVAINSPPSVTSPRKVGSYDGETSIPKASPPLDTDHEDDQSFGHPLTLTQEQLDMLWKCKTLLPMNEDQQQIFIDAVRQMVFCTAHIRVDEPHPVPTMQKVELSTPDTFELDDNGLPSRPEPGPSQGRKTCPAPCAEPGTAGVIEVVGTSIEKGGHHHHHHQKNYVKLHSGYSPCQNHVITDKGLAHAECYRVGDGVTIETEFAVSFPHSEGLFGNLSKLEQALYRHVCGCLTHEKGKGIILFGIDREDRTIIGFPKQACTPQRAARNAIDNVFSSKFKPPLFPDQYKMRFIPVHDEKDTESPTLLMIEVMIDKGCDEYHLTIFGTPDDECDLRCFHLIDIPPYCEAKLRDKQYRRKCELECYIGKFQDHIDRQREALQNVCTVIAKLKETQNPVLVELVESIVVCKSEIEAKTETNEGLMAKRDELCEKFRAIRDNRYYNYHTNQLNLDHHGVMTQIDMIKGDFQSLLSSEITTKRERVVGLRTLMNILKAIKDRAQFARDGLKDPVGSEAVGDMDQMNANIPQSPRKPVTRYVLCELREPSTPPPPPPKHHQQKKQCAPQHMYILR